jgi:hypothetical protein
MRVLAPIAFASVVNRNPNALKTKLFVADCSVSKWFRVLRAVLARVN